MSRRDSLWLVLLSAAALAIGCSKGAEQQRDTAAASGAIGGPNANPVDTGMTSSTRDSAGMRGATPMDTGRKDSTRKAP
jgi:hypothetical protein